MTAISALAATPTVSAPLAAGPTPAVSTSAMSTSADTAADMDMSAVSVSAVSDTATSGPGVSVSAMSGASAATARTPGAPVSTDAAATPAAAGGNVQADINLLHTAGAATPEQPDILDDGEADLDDVLDADGDVVLQAVSHLQAASTAFDAMVAEPRLAALDCDAIAATNERGPDLGLPAGRVNLGVLREWLLANPDNFAAKDAVWRALIGLARAAGGDWRLAALGMAMPALVRLAGQVSAGYDGDRHDLDAETVVGFLTALDRETDLDRPAPYASLLMAAFRAAHERRVSEAGPVSVPDIEAVAAGPRVPHRPYGHPDLLVHRAALLGVIADADVEPFIEVRVAGRAIEPVAERLHVTVDCLRMRLVRAGERLAEALAAGELTAAPVPAAARRLADARTGEPQQRTATVTALPTRARRRRRQAAMPGAAAA